MSKLDEHPDITYYHSEVQPQQDGTIKEILVVYTAMPLSNLSSDFDEQRFNGLCDFLKGIMLNSPIDSVTVRPDTERPNR